MVVPIPINDREEYQFVIQRGYQPLLDYKRFKLDIRLRVEIQRELFGRGRIDTMQANERFFQWIWAHKPHRCEETLRPLPQYSAVYCSHILTRGAYPEMATDPRNINILCFEMHNKWENGDKKSMRIYPENARLIELMKNEYNLLRRYGTKDI